MYRHHSTEELKEIIKNTDLELDSLSTGNLTRKTDLMARKSMIEKEINKRGKSLPEIYERIQLLIESAREVWFVDNDVNVLIKKVEEKHNQYYFIAHDGEVFEMDACKEEEFYYIGQKHLFESM